ncbi:LysM peptidoglycan-binding domain-containing protein [Cytophagaceae bacterium BD1B2-1]|uniref:LysM peptidoglycan-binding domain-containing protein n=2 Tax=Xanthocytophaga agilis TaxID=3048010 RepID=A0AAE3UEH3_9BACT|nr:LysM peptidoglycan-binding domain-containing protein [Xanthocytophaga agilis]
MQPHFNMNKYFPVVLLSFLSSFFITLHAADIPEQLDFAGIRLKIKDNIRDKISTDVDRLTKPGKHAEAKLERIRMYFPLIEKVLAEEGLPNNFKYLVIQESDLIADAVSTSNAVGFWQFKRETALEMGLAVNSDVDERKHIVASTRAAARYLKRNNFFFDNWLYALMAYNTGLTGAKNLVGEGDKGATRMEIDKDTHWYILKFLAHQIAFEKSAAISSSSLVLAEYPCKGGQKLSDIASTFNIQEEELALYNKWLSSRRVPEDKPYTILVPVPASQADVIASTNKPAPTTSPTTTTKTSIFNYEYSHEVEADFRQSSKFPVLKKKETIFYEINGRAGIMAASNDNIMTLAEKGHLSIEKFMTYNDLKSNDAIVSGKVYYLKKKRNKAKLHFHTVIEGETLWEISQKYGIREKSLKTKNRLGDNEKLEHGRILWLRFRRPSSKPVEIRNIPRPTPKPATTPVVKEPVKSTTPVVKQPTVTPTTPVTTPEEKQPVVTSPQTEQQNTSPVVTPPVVTKPTPTNQETSAPIVVTPPKNEPVKQEPTVVTQPKTEEVVLVNSHNVQAGETLYSIARQYKVSVAQLRQWNSLSETASLSIGQRLIVGDETPITTNTSAPVITKPTTVSKPAASTTTHTVQAGETLYSISRRYGVSVAEIRQWNNLAETDGVQIGQALSIRAQSTTKNSVDTTKTQPTSSVSVTEYEVKPGDTLYKIAKAYGVTVEKLLEWNNKTTPSVSIGEKLKIKK